MLRWACALLLLMAWATENIATGEEIRALGALVKLIEEADLPALETGVLESFLVGEGAAVNAGDVLAKTLDVDAKLLVERHRREWEIAARAAQHRAKIISAEATLRNAQSEVKRAQQARQRVGNAVSDAELDRLELAVTQGELSVQQAEHEFELARLEAELKSAELAIAERLVERHQIKAPFNGVVAQVYRRRGEWVQPGEKTLRLVRTDRLKVEAFVMLDKVNRLAVGAPATLQLDGTRPLSFTGQLTFISPEADPFNGQTRVVAEVDNRQGILKPGQKGTLALRGGE